MAQERLVLEGYHKHLVLFAKGHYGHFGMDDDDLIDRMRIIVGYISAIPREKVTLGDVYYLVSETFVKLCVARQPECVKWFLHNILVRPTSGTITPAKIIREMLGEIASLRISDGDFILEMGGPDPKFAELLAAQVSRVR